MSKKEEKINDLKEQFNKIQEDHKDFDVNKYLAKREEDLPDLGEIQIFDYDLPLEQAKEQATEVLESMVDLYLGDNPQVASHKYIQKKMREDARVYADTIFIQEMTKKNLLTQLRQVDNGDTSARMHEAINQSIANVRDNIKFSQSQRSELEKYWKEMRRDLGLNEISEEMEQKNIENSDEDPKEDGKIVDARSLNDMIDKLIKGDRKD
jgi:hypothetical protein